MRIRRRGLTRFQVVIATVVGGIAGAYIWKPIFEKHLGTGPKAPEDKVIVSAVPTSTVTPQPPAHSILISNKEPQPVSSTEKNPTASGAEQTELLTFEFEAAHTTE